MRRNNGHQSLTATIGRIFAVGLFVVGYAASSAPVAHATDTSAQRWEQLSAGGDFDCAITKGEVYCWGFNYTGQLGDGTYSDRTTPTKVGGLLAGKTVTYIDAGTEGACAIAGGELYCWGHGGNLGNGTNVSDSKVPVKVQQDSGVLAGKTVTKVSVGVGSACAVADGEAYCWGGDYGEILGNGPGFNNSTVPEKVVQDSGVLAGKIVTDIGISSHHTCALASGQVYCWGNNYGPGAVGVGSAGGYYDVPAQVVQDSGVLAGKTVTNISVGSDSTCALAEGKIYCWGGNYFGQLGNTTNTDQYSPIEVGGALSGKVVSQISSMDVSICAITGSDLYCWGDNEYGSIGDGTQNNSNTPVLIPRNASLSADKTIESIAVSEYNYENHACVLAAGAINCWGSADLGAPGFPTGNYTLSPTLKFAFPNIDTVSNQMTTPLSTRPTFTGVAQPGSTVEVTVHSDPVTCSTTADSNGNWSCTLPSDLPAGQHTVNVVVTTPANDVINLGPYTVTVAGGSTLSGNINSPDTGLGTDLSWGVVAVVVLLICSALFILIPKRKRIS